MNYKRSKELFKEAKQFIAGGVDSPVRSFASVGGDPLFIDKGEDSNIIDVDGNKYIDYVCSWGPLILGHRDNDVISSIKTVLERGTSFGAPIDLETELAKIIHESDGGPSKIRFVNSGTEATMSAIRLARGVTGRDKIIKFEGCYHGHSDSLLVKAGSGTMTLGQPTSPGVPAALAKETIVLPYNDENALRDYFEKYGEQIACVIVEPIAANMGLIAPKDGFLESISEQTHKYGALFIADEVLVGFRTCFGTTVSKKNLDPDLICYGKVIGGGLPVAAYGGKSIYMDRMSPDGPVYQAGTLSGNPLCMAAGIATLKRLKRLNPYGDFEKLSAALYNGFKQSADKHGIDVQLPHAASLFSIFFSKTEVSSLHDVKNSDLSRFNRYFWFMLNHGIYLAPSPFETAFLSIKHTMDQIYKTVEVFDKFLDEEIK